MSFKNWKGMVCMSRFVGTGLLSYNKITGRATVSRWLRTIDTEISLQLKPNKLNEITWKNNFKVHNSDVEKYICFTCKLIIGCITQLYSSIQEMSSQLVSELFLDSSWFRSMQDPFLLGRLHKEEQ
jgi:hypothetical protein